MNTLRTGLTAQQSFTRVAAMIIAAVFLAAAVVLGGSLPSQAATAPNTFSGITYTPDAETRTATVSGYDKSFGTKVTIPETIVLDDGNSYKVTSIGDSAFNRRELTEISLPESITHIDEWAFADNALTEIEIPEAVTHIGSFAFHRNSLETVTIPAAVTHIDEWAFSANYLTSITLTDGLASIGDMAFVSNRLTAVTIPGSVTSIGDGAFAHNGSLGRVTFTGAAPAAFSTGVAGSDTGSLGDPNTGVRVIYRYAFENTGYTVPAWQGYPTQTVSYTVQFDPNNGAANHIDTYGEDEVAVAPADPARDGYIFIGWYTNPDITNPYDFGTPIRSNFTLYAGWAQDDEPAENPDQDPDQNPGQDPVPPVTDPTDDTPAGNDTPAEDETPAGNEDSAADDNNADHDTQDDSNPSDVPAADEDSAGNTETDSAVDSKPANPSTDTETAGSGTEGSTGSANTSGTADAAAETAGVTGLATTGSSTNMWLPVTAGVLLIAGAGVLIARRSMRARNQ